MKSSIWKLIGCCQDSTQMEAPPPLPSSVPALLSSNMDQLSGLTSAVTALPAVSVMETGSSGLAMKRIRRRK